MTSSSISKFLQEHLNMTSLGSAIDHLELDRRTKEAAIVYRFNVLNAAEIMLRSFFSGNKSLLREKIMKELEHDDNSDINAQNNFGDTPLHIAARQANPKSIQLLIKAKANVDIKNSKGLAARDCVPSEEPKCIEALDALMKGLPAVPSTTSAGAASH
jgi:ankyrin repeat protein